MTTGRWTKQGEGSISYNLQISTGSKWPEEVRISQLFGDALRMRILAECNQREMSPQSFHRLVGGGTLSKVDRAFELLVQYDWLERTRSEGEEEHFYRGTASPTMADEVFAALPDSTKALVTSRIFESLAARTREAMKAGTIAARPDTHFTWTPLELDQQGWDDLIARLDSIFLSLAEEQDRAQARMEDTGEEPIQMTLAMLGFESPKNPERKFS